MLCQNCQKNNATIHFTKIVNGSVEEMHLCDSCAKKNNDLDFDFPFSFQKIFTGLIGPIQEGKQEIENITCPQCGLTYKKFMEVGKFGCAECYETFREDVDSLLKGIHGHNEHNGKVPMRTNSRTIQKKAIESLRIQLEESIVKEDFERAAFLRDEIKKLKSNTDGCER
ncbi:UvrB/UvrC motif-containing protein [Tissierella praeacuta]|uniref:UvrB/UvrC motif-containing protein n=1 Tax=Tissierella praeacuta TaxID=43131 RepID=UPI00333F674A